MTDFIFFACCSDALDETLQPTTADAICNTLFIQLFPINTVLNSEADGGQANNEKN